MPRPCSGTPPWDAERASRSWEVIDGGTHARMIAVGSLVAWIVDHTRIGAADREAERALVDGFQAQHGQALFGFARRQGLSDAQADDVVQETLLRLWTALVGGDRIVDPKGWAYRVAFRLAMDQHRLRRRVAALAGALAVSHPPSGSTSDDRIAVWAEVDRLPERQRQVLYLRYRADLSFDQIGAALGITASAARSHSTQAMTTLRRRLGDGDEA